MWPSWFKASALGAEDPEFKSRHPDNQLLGLTRMRASHPTHREAMISCGTIPGSPTLLRQGLVGQALSTKLAGLPAEAFAIAKA